MGNERERFGLIPVETQLNEMSCVLVVPDLSLSIYIICWNP